MPQGECGDVARVSGIERVGAVSGTGTASVCGRSESRSFRGRHGANDLRAVTENIQESQAYFVLTWS